MEETLTQVIYEGDQPPVLVLRTAVVRVVRGPDAGASCNLKQELIRVGSASDNNLVLSDPQVSRHHLELRVQDRGYRVRDLGSTNGSFSPWGADPGGAAPARW